MDYIDAAFRVLAYTQTQAPSARGAYRWGEIAGAFRHYQTNILPHELRVAEARIVEARGARRGMASRGVDTPQLRESLRIVDAWRRRASPRSAEQAAVVAAARREFDQFVKHGVSNTVAAARAYGYPRLANSLQRHLDAMTTPDELDAMIRTAILAHLADLAAGALAAYTEACRHPARTLPEACYQTAAYATARHFFGLWATALANHITDKLTAEA